MSLPDSSSPLVRASAKCHFSIARSIAQATEFHCGIRHGSACLPRHDDKGLGLQYCELIHLRWIAQLALRFLMLNHALNRRVRLSRRLLRCDIVGCYFYNRGSGSIRRKIPQWPPIGQVGAGYCPREKLPPQGTYRTACPSACLRRQLSRQAHQSDDDPNLLIPGQSVHLPLSATEPQTISPSNSRFYPQRFFTTLWTIYVAGN